MTSTMSFFPSPRSFAPSLTSAQRSRGSLPVTFGGVADQAVSRTPAIRPISLLNAGHAFASASECSAIERAVRSGSRQSTSGRPSNEGATTAGSAATSSKPRPARPSSLTTPA